MYICIYALACFAKTSHFLSKNIPQGPFPHAKPIWHCPTPRPQLASTTTTTTVPTLRGPWKHLAYVLIQVGGVEATRGLHLVSQGLFPIPPALVHLLLEGLLRSVLQAVIWRALLAGAPCHHGCYLWVLSVGAPHATTLRKLPNPAKCLDCCLYISTLKSAVSHGGRDPGECFFDRKWLGFAKLSSNSALSPSKIAI